MQFREVAHLRRKCAEVVAGKTKCSQCRELAYLRWQRVKLVIGKNKCI